MSFSGTPLGQGRRLDHSTFLGKLPSHEHRPKSPQLILSTSYSYGASTLKPRSPAKNSSPVHQHREDNPDTITATDLSALERYKKQKALQQTTRSGAPKTFNSNLNPENWTVNGTTVNIATALHQAVSSDMSLNYKTDNAWASGSTRQNNAVPRSTSVEYEQEVQRASIRGPFPGKKFDRTVQRHQNVSKSSSSVIAEDPAAIFSSTMRGKSQLKDLVGKVSFYVKQRTDMSGADPDDSGYNYSAEEQAFAAEKEKRQASRKGGISIGNQAYKPPEDEESSEESGNEKSGRRKKTKKNSTGGPPLTTLPVVSADKRKRRRGKAGKGMDDDRIPSDVNTASHIDMSPESTSPTSAAGSHQLNEALANDSDDSLDMTRLELNFIPPEIKLESVESQRDESHRSTPSQRSRAPFSIGANLGQIVNLGRACFIWVLKKFIDIFSSFLPYLAGKVSGTIFNVMLNRPSQWLPKIGPVRNAIKYLLIGLTLYCAWCIVQGFDMLSSVPSFSFPYSNPRPIFIPSHIPASNIAEIADRLQNLENLLSGFSAETERARIRAEESARAYSELFGRLHSLENNIVAENKRAIEAETKAEVVLTKDMGRVKHNLALLEAQFQHQKETERTADVVKNGSDEEARAKLKVLEERVGSIEGGVKEAIELSKKSAVVSNPPVEGSIPTWWYKISSNNNAKPSLTITSTDGHDVTSLISHLVDSAFSTFRKDDIARPDFALHSGGARIIPSLTSPTFEIRPTSLRSHLVGLVTGNGYAIGRPPITALHHELHNGHCWPFKGSQGQLGVALSAPIYLEAISIDHVASETAFDMRSAPRLMEVWAMVEGEDNIAKIDAFMQEKTARRKVIESGGTDISIDEEPAYPATLPKSPPYIRVANFSYDITASNNIQTFPVDPEFKTLGVDFGIVVLRVLNNWGRDDFTCLYRFRVHGQRIGETPLPYSDKLSEHS